MCGWEKVPDNIEVRNLKKNFGLIGQMTVWENIATFGQRENRAISGSQQDALFYKRTAGTLWSGCILGISVDRLSAVQKFAVALIKAKLEGADLIMAVHQNLGIPCPVLS